MLKKIYLLMVLCVGFMAYTQTLSTSINKKTVGLGEANELHIKINNLQGKDVQSAPKNKLLPFHFEIIKDSIFKKKDSYERNVEFAVFQEGKMTIPALEFKIDGQIQKTTPYEIEVVNTANKDDKIQDIMQNKEVAMGFRDYWQLYKFWFLGAILLIAIIFFVFIFLKNSKKQKNSPKALTNQTLKDLQALKNKNFIGQDNYRAFYVELIEIMREFLTKQYHIPADVLLTDDLIAFMKRNNSISQPNEAVVEEVFLRGDLVKFAKIFPSKEMMETDWQACEKMVKNSIKDIEFENLRKDV